MKLFSKLQSAHFLLLTLVLSIALAVRLYEIDRPIADWHSWRQADTAAVARNFIKEGYTPFVPRYDDMSSQANQLDNPNRYRFVEFPVYNSIVAAVWFFTGPNVAYARLVTVVITLASTLLLYLIVRHFSGTRTAFLAALFFAIIPYNVFYSSSILPGPLMTMGVLATYYSFIRFIKAENTPWLLSAIFWANVAILSWPIALFFMLPPIYLALEKYRFGIFKKPQMYIFAAASLAPFIAWRMWMLKFPEGIPNMSFLLNENDIRFKGAFFKWIVIERLGKLILTVGGFPLLVFGILLKPDREKLFYYCILASAAIYVIVFASGNVRHDYYQIPIIPALCIFMAKAVEFLIRPPKQNFQRLVSPAVVLALIVFMVVFGFNEVRGYYWINKPAIVEAGRAADELLPKDALVLAPYGGDTSLLYQTNRHGYPATDRSLEKLIDSGVMYLVSVDVGDRGIQNLAEDCKLIKGTDTYLIVEMYQDCIGK